MKSDIFQKQPNWSDLRGFQNLGGLPQSIICALRISFLFCKNKKEGGFFLHYGKFYLPGKLIYPSFSRSEFHNFSNNKKNTLTKKRKYEQSHFSQLA